MQEQHSVHSDIVVTEVRVLNIIIYAQFLIRNEKQIKNNVINCTNSSFFIEFLKTCQIKNFDNSLYIYV